MKRHLLASVHGENSLPYGDWLVLTRAVGRDPADHHGEDFGRLPNTKIVRINHGYYPHGTLPLPQYYEDFSTRVANYVDASSGCSRWIIGNEPNHEQERPQGQLITPAKYAECYALCRQKIRNLKFHSGDQVLIGAVAPWNNTTTYPGNPTGSWVQYLEDVQYELPAIRGCDGFAIHSYAREQTPASITDDTKMSGAFEDCFWGFRHYLNWMAAILPRFQGLPVYMTEFCIAGKAWKDLNTGVIQAAYDEIDAWNEAHLDRPILAGPTVYRWQYDQWAFHDKPHVQDDFLLAADKGYSFPRETDPPDPPEETDMLSNPSLELAYIRDSQHSTVNVAHGWTYFASDGKPPERDGPCQLPEYKALHHSEDPRRVYAGETAQCWFIRWKIMDAGIYQFVDSVAGATYQFDAMCQAWCSDKNDPTVSDGDMHVMLGIDPMGGADAFSTSVVWSNWQRAGADYKQFHSPRVVAEAGQITVYIRAWNKWELSHNDIYVDDCHLVKEGDGTPPGGGDVDYDLIRQIVREELDKTVWASGAP